MKNARIELNHILLYSVKNERIGFYGKENTGNKCAEVGMTDWACGWRNQFNGGRVSPWEVQVPSLLSITSASDTSESIFQTAENFKRWIYSKSSHTQSNQGQHPLIKRIIISAALIFTFDGPFYQFRSGLASNAFGH